jgi:type IX secretion system PorP/SprF family membrane protein
VFYLEFMYLKSDMRFITRILLILAIINIFNASYAQQTPLNPLSYWVFTPYVYNPAMVGSKDYTTLDFNASFQGESNTQILSGNARLSKTKPGYFSSPKLKEFNGIGLGGSIFNDKNGPSHNIGVSGAGSIQIPLSTKDLSFLSFGVAVKGIYNMLDTGITDAGSATKSSFFPNVDAGVYYYGTNLFTGFSAINILGNPGKADSLGNYEIPLSRQFFFTVGYKFILSKSQNFVIEPSVLIDATDSTFDDLGDLKDNITPILKLYLDNICLGSYFLTDGNTSFFFQYRFPRISLGAFYELPRNTAYYKKPPIVEFTLGWNFQSDKSRFSKRSRW